MGVCFVCFPWTVDFVVVVKKAIIWRQLWTICFCLLKLPLVQMGWPCCRLGTLFFVVHRCYCLYASFVLPVVLVMGVGNATGMHLHSRDQDTIATRSDVFFCSVRTHIVVHLFICIVLRDICQQALVDVVQLEIRVQRDL